MNLGIITPTYNRKKLLQRLYKSLMNQTDYDFTWIIVDDGSTDETDKYIDSLSSEFKIRYYFKENGGKIKALNMGFNSNKDIDLFLVVDSDDYLLSNAVSTVLNYGEKYLHNDAIGGLFFRYQFEDGQLLGKGKNIPDQDTPLSRIEHDSKYDKIDGSIAYYKKAIKKYTYPEFNNERYMGPFVLQLMMSKEFQILFSTEVIGVAEYQPDGLTASGRKIRIESPKSMLVYCHYMQDSQFNQLSRIKYGIMANAYYYFANSKYSMERTDKIIEGIKIPKIYRMPGYLLYQYWGYRYS